MVDITTVELIAGGVIIAFFAIYGIIVFRRKRSWYILHILGDYTNLHNPQSTFLMGEKFDKGVIVGKCYRSYLSWWSAFTINSIPDLQSYQFGKHLFVYRGVTGLAGDINYAFVMPPLIGKPSANKLVTKMTTDMAQSMSDALKNMDEKSKRRLTTDPSVLDDLLLKTITPEWVEKNVGIVTLRKEDVFLREDRVVHAAINSDSADFAAKHQDQWQKLMQLLYPISILIVLIVMAIACYIILDAFTNAQGTTYSYDQYLATQLNQQIQQTNGANAYLYAILKSINVYGVQIPKNQSLVTLPTNPNNGSGILPTLPSLPSV